MAVAALVAEAARRRGDAVAVVDADDRTATWSQLEQRVAATAGALRDAGVRPGQRVGVLLPNSIAFAVAYWAALRAGAVVVPLNPAYTHRELVHILGDAGAVAVLVAPHLGDSAAGAVEGLAEPARVLPVTAEGLDGEPAPCGPVGRDEVAVICYTSGTTGRPKGARLTHGNLLANLDGMDDLHHLSLRPDDVLLGALPFFHVFGLNVVLNAAARHAARVVVLDRFSPRSSLERSARHGVTVLYGAPPMFAAWAAAGSQAGSRVRAAVSGADSLPVATFHRFAEQFGVEILEGYGLTETAPVLTSTAASPEVRPGTVGHPLPGVRVEVRDPLGRRAAVDEVGEIWACGPNVFAGYHGQPEATAEVLQEGWFATGDLGAVDADGYLTIAGRLKDLVIVSGFNVYPREVELVLGEHPAVAECAVVGVPDPRTGERVRAVVVLRAGAGADREALLAHCRRELARYKVPREIEIVDALPRTALGKVRRGALAEG